MCDFHMSSRWGLDIANRSSHNVRSRKLGRERNAERTSLNWLARGNLLLKVPLLAPPPPNHHHHHHQRFVLWCGIHPRFSNLKHCWMNQTKN